MVVSTLQQHSGRVHEVDHLLRLQVQRTSAPDNNWLSQVHHNRNCHMNIALMLQCTESAAAAPLDTTVGTNH
jgi:hypothetical protein